MIGNSAILDTNVVIEIFNNNLAIADQVDSLDTFYINAVVLGELYVGINRVSNKQKHLQKLFDFRKLSHFLYVNETTAVIYGEMSAALFKKGKPIPTNDVWIAATAKQYNLTLFTKDKHFHEIEGIDVQFL